MAFKVYKEYKLSRLDDGTFSKEHKMYGTIPLHNNWAKYYEVEFEKTPKIYKLELKLSNAHFDDATIVFESE